MKKLTEEEAKQENLKIAREASWLSSIFQEHNLTVEDKQEIFRRTLIHLREQDLQLN